MTWYWQASVAFRNILRREGPFATASQSARLLWRIADLPKLLFLCDFNVVSLNIDI